MSDEHSAFENRVRRELDGAAREVSPDLQTMWGIVQARLDHPGQRPHSRIPRVPTRLSMAAACAAVLIVVGAGALTGRIFDPPAGPGPAERAADGPTDAPVSSTQWACPHQTTITARDSPPWWLIGTSEDILAEAKAFDVPRYQLLLDGEQGELRYGTSDGRLLSTSRLHKTESGWRVVGRTLCSGRHGSAIPRTDTWTALTAHATPASPPNPLAPTDEDAQTFVGTPVLIDARTFYEQTGQESVRTLYAVPAADCRPFPGSACATEVSRVDRPVTSGSQGSNTAFPSNGVGCGSIVSTSYESQETLGRPPWLCSYYAPDDMHLDGVTVTGDGGDETALTAFRADDWQGTYFAGIVTFEPERATYARADGSSQTADLGSAPRTDE